MIIGIFYSFLLGLCWGSFANVLSYRLYNNLSLKGRSFCPHCHQIIYFRDLIPLLSFILLGQRCRFCQTKINWQYFLIELSAGILFVMIFIKYGALNLFLLRDLFFILVLLLIFIFDLNYYLIPDKIIWPALVVALVINLYLGSNLGDLILAGLITMIFFGSQYLLTKGQGIGQGDIKLGVLLGVMFGWQLVVLNLVLAYFIGGLVAAILLLSKKKKVGDILPLGAFLSLAAIIVLIWGKTIITYFLI